jgi:hypothetical protein
MLLDLEVASGKLGRVDNTVPRNWQIPALLRLLILTVVRLATVVEILHRQ